MICQFVPCLLRSCASSSRPRYELITKRFLSTDLDFSHEKPAPHQLEHIQLRLTETVPLMFRHRLDYTFYRKDVFCDDQVFRLQKHGRDELMRHFGMIGFLGQFCLPHVEMEVISVIPMIEDATVRCRWRVKYVSFLRLFTNYRLFRFEYRMKNLSWFDGYSVLSVDGNGMVHKITLQRNQRDEGPLLDAKSAKDKLVEKIAVLQPRQNEPVTNCVPRQREEHEYTDRKQ